LVAGFADSALATGPADCYVNGICVSLSAQSAEVCVGDAIRYSITVSNSGAPGACQATNLHVRFWAPNNPPNALPNICGSTNSPTAYFNIPTLAPGESRTFACPTIPQLCYPTSTSTPASVDAYLCVQGTSATACGIILDARCITTRVRPVPCEITCPPFAPCVSPADCAVCERSYGLVFCGSPGVDTWLWSISGNGTIVGSKTGQCVTVNAGAAGSFTLTLTVTKNACTNTCTRLVTVRPKPPCTISGPSTICPSAVGEQFCGPAGLDTYSWSISGSGSIVGSSTSPCVTVLGGLGGSYTLTLSVIDDGCCATCTKTVKLDCPCRVTGGGNDGRVPPNGYASCHAGGNFYTFGGQAGAPKTGCCENTAGDDQPWGEWTHRQHSGPLGDFTFHGGTASAPPGTLITCIICSDPPACRPANNPAPTRQIDFEGVGSIKNIQAAPPGSGFVRGGLYAFEVHIEDLGEPGNSGSTDPGLCPPGGSAGGHANCGCPDFYHIKIHRDCSFTSPVVYEVFGYIDGGNFQIHEPTGSRMQSKCGEAVPCGG
jgi:hypothetical protein